MASPTPEGQEIFGAKYDPADEVWLRAFFTPSKRSQAAGRKYLERQRTRKVNRDPLPNEKAAPAQLAALPEMGRPRERSLCLPEEDHSADARGQRQQRRARLYGELFHPPAKPTGRAAHSVSRQQSWCAVPIPGAVC